MRNISSNIDDVYMNPDYPQNSDKNLLIRSITILDYVTFIKLIVLVGSTQTNHIIQLCRYIKLTLFPTIALQKRFETLRVLLTTTFSQKRYPPLFKQVIDGPLFEKKWSHAIIERSSFRIIWLLPISVLQDFGPVISCREKSDKSYDPCISNNISHDPVS